MTVWASVAGQQSSFLLRATLLYMLLCSPQHVRSDSDEAVLTEWEIWKSINGINYEERVSLNLKLCGHIQRRRELLLLLSVFRMTCRGELSGRRITG